MASRLARVGLCISMDFSCLGKRFHDSDDGSFFIFVWRQIAQWQVGELYEH